MDVDFADQDFARARNRSIARATGDVVLVLDADETVAPGSAERIRRLVDQSTRVASIVSRKNLHDDGRVTVDYATRLFPNDEKIRYRNRVHETVDDAVLAAGVRLCTSDVEIVHHLAPADVLREKSRRYVCLLREELAKDAEDTNALAFLATECHKLGDIAEAMQITETLVRLRPNDPTYHLNLGLYRFAHADTERARTSVRRAITLKPDFGAAHAALAWMT